MLFVLRKNFLITLPVDWISFVTASPYFLHPNDPLAEGPHRLQLFIQDDEYGNPALHSISMPALSDEEEFIDTYNPEPYLITRAVQGFEILIYDFDNEDWTDEWDFDNHIPQRLLISIFVASEDETEEPVIYSRVFNIPVAESMDQPLSAPTTANTVAQNDNGGNAGNSTIKGRTPAMKKSITFIKKARRRSLGISFGYSLFLLHRRFSFPSKQYLKGCLFHEKRSSLKLRCSLVPAIMHVLSLSNHWSPRA